MSISGPEVSKFFQENGYFHARAVFPASEVRKTVLAQLHRGDDCVEPGNTHPNARLVLSGWNSHAKRSLGNE